MINDKEIDALIEQAIKEEQALPEGLGDRLSQSIDAWQQAEQQHRTKCRQTLVVRLSFAVAASLLLLLLVKWYPASSSTQQEFVASISIWEDTYTDPKEASIAAQKALQLLSSNLNKGMDVAAAQTAKAGEVRDIVKKQLTIR